MSQTPTSNTPYQQEVSQSERAKLLREEREAGSRVAYTRITDPEPSGRWAKPDQINGATAVVDYPRIAGGPWGGGPQVPEEPPLGIDVSYVEPCGEPFEQERAAEIAAVAEPVGPAADSLAGVSSPSAIAADPSGFTEGLATSASTSLSAVATAPQVEADPSSLGPNPPPSSGGQLAAPPADAASAHSEGANRAEHRRGGAALSSRGWRRIG